MTRRRTLAFRVALVTTVVAVVTVVVAGLVSFSLVRSAALGQARRSLGALATTVAVQRAQTGEVLRLHRQVRLLSAEKIRIAMITPAGAVVGDPLARDILTSGDVQGVLAGHDLSVTRRESGSTVLVEARPTGSSGVVLVQRQNDAAGLAAPVLRRTLLALLIGLVVAVIAGLLLARRLARPLQKAAGAAHDLAAGARDVRLVPEGPAEVAEVAESLNSLAAALERSEGRQREFLLSVSHELRTPLTAISGFAESLADGVTTGPDTAPVGATMLAEARRLERLVSDLLDLARLGADNFRIDLAPVELTALVRHAGAVWQARCRAERVRFRLEVPDHEVVTVTDPTRVRQIIDGLAENALRVTPPDAPIVLGLAVRGGAAYLALRDGGPGLTEDDLAVAFERSVLYDRYRGIRRVGTGVGLALVHGLATRLGGSAQAGRAPEGGASFVVRLPLRPAPAVEIGEFTVPQPPVPLDRAATARRSSDRGGEAGSIGGPG
ncbi:MAG TPA: HAMP domain-containing sensor histidine kinase [Mycobacteriales bacterium]|jgi:two-component system sensor histidine kinase BaeS